MYKENKTLYISLRKTTHKKFDIQKKNTLKSKQKQKVNVIQEEGRVSLLILFPHVNVVLQKAL